MKKNETVIKEWSEIRSDFDSMSQMSCLPKMKKLKKGDVIDEDQSVRWNREQVEKSQADYQKEVARLNTIKNKARDAVYDDIYARIQYEIPGISKEAACKVYEYAYSEGHSYGFNEVVNVLDGIIDLINEVIECK